MKQSILTRLNYIENKINKKSVLFFDLDGTLIDTDIANSISYIDSIYKLTGYNINVGNNNRFTSSEIKIILRNINKTDYNQILFEKEQLYNINLKFTNPNIYILNTLLKYYKKNQIVLVTNSKKNRALNTLKFYGIDNKFDYLFYAEDKTTYNKYLDSISSLKISTENIIIFENEQKEIKNAISAGIKKHNIFNA